jgi:hypothetical protein
MKRNGFVLGCASVLCLAIPLLTACAAGPDVGCQGGLDAEQCFAHCKRFASCSECAAQPACGWCGASPGGACIPALRGEDRRNERPDSRCDVGWYYRTADLQAPDGPPFCPAIAAPESSTPTNGGES